MILNIISVTDLKIEADDITPKTKCVIEKIINSQSRVTCLYLNHQKLMSFFICLLQSEET